MLSLQLKEPVYEHNAESSMRRIVYSKRLASASSISSGLPAEYQYAGWMKLLNFGAKRDDFQG